MNNKLTVSFCFLYLLVVLSGCNGIESNDDLLVNESLPQMEEPPSVYLEYDDVLMSITRGTSNWELNYSDGTTKAILADSAAPPGLVRNQAVDVVVNNGDIMTISFEEPPESHRIRVWNDQEDIGSAEYVGDANLQFVIPEETNEVIFEVIATWEQGTAHYAFKVTIDEAMSNQSLPVNESGETYGTGRDEDAFENGPDLIRALGINGIVGYVRQTELEGESPETIEEALEQNDVLESEFINVYKKDGVTVIDQFEISP